MSATLISPLAASNGASGMSAQEYAFLVEMAQTSEEWLTAIAALADKFWSAPQVPSVEKFATYSAIGVRMARRLCEWSKANLELQRFPANYEELSQAITLCGDGWTRCEMISKRVEHLVYESKGKPDKAPENIILLNNADIVITAALRSKKFSTMLLRAREATSKIDGSVDSSALIMPEDA